MVLTSSNNLIIVSIHAPHGVRLRLQGEPHHDLSFQSTHPHGVRPSYIEAQTVHSSVVSIHAPTRGATLCNPSYLAACCCFNPRTHTGCDLLGDNWRVLDRVSIHAPTRGATGGVCDAIPIRRGFNPRTHTGCDIIRCQFFRLLGVSIHAPTRGATMDPSLMKVNWVSIHAPTRGATLCRRRINTER